jgi:hypothetical protein
MRIIKGGTKITIFKEGEKHIFDKPETGSGREFIQASSKVRVLSATIKLTLA